MTCKRVLALCCGWLLLGAADLQAQNAVLLRMQPRIGDTLYLRVEQEIEMRGTAQGPDSVRAVESKLRLRARAIPTATAGGATTITAITDSLVIGPGGALPQVLDRARAALQGRRVEARVFPDGAVELVDPADHDDEGAAVLGHMPALLPQREVRPGDHWTREMRLPVRGTREMPGFVRATFRLDSLSRDGRVAYISVRGAFYDRPAGTPGQQRELDGSLSGTMEFDRQIGWITDSRTTITMRTELQPPDPRMRPMAVWMRVNQRLRARTSR